MTKWSPMPLGTHVLDFTPRQGLDQGSMHLNSLAGAAIPFLHHMQTSNTKHRWAQAELTGSCMFSCMSEYGRWQRGDEGLGCM